MRELRLPLRLYALAVGAAGTLALIATVPTALPNASTLALFAALFAFATVARLAPVPLSPKMKITVEDAATFAAALVLGPFYAMCVAAFSVLIVYPFRMRGPLVQHVFNASASALGAGACAVAFRVLAGESAPTIADHPFPVLAAAAAKYVVDTSLVDIAVGLQLRRDPIATWWPVHRRDILPVSALYFLGVLAAVSVTGHPWLIAAFVVPVGLVLFSLRESVRLREQTRAAIHQLADLVDLRDPYTHGHSQRVAVLAERLARAMRLPETQVDLIREAARVHDIGKIGTEDHVLLKPGPLDDREREEMHKHSAYGAELLARVPEFWEGASLVLSHHERPDGNGYPRGLRGAELPLEVSVIAIADAYDAMMTDRPYRAALPWEQVRTEFLRHRGTQWDAKVVDFFVAMIDAEARTGEALRYAGREVAEPA